MVIEMAIPDATYRLDGLEGLQQAGRLGQLQRGSDSPYIAGEAARMHAQP